METTNVTSSFIASVSWEADPGTEDSGTVKIIFKDSAEFAYYEVSRSDYDALVNAASVGKHFHAFWKNVYRGERQ